MWWTSEISGTLRSTYRPSASVHATISLSAEFLAPPIGTEPERGPEGRTTNSDTAPSMDGRPVPHRNAPVGSRLVPRLTQNLELDAAALSRRLRPRDDLLVKETAPEPPPPEDASSGTVTYGVEEGPFDQYERTVEWTAQPDGSTTVTESFRWKAAIPYWGGLYRPLATRALRDGIAPGRRPWWSTPDRLNARQSTLIAAMALHSMVGGALFAVLTQVLTFASADLGNGSSGQQADVFAVVRLGVVVTVVVTALADKVGRRRIAVWSFAAAAVLTIASAAVPTLAALTVLQLLARNLAIAGLLCVDTIVIEELPAGSRAMASGLGAMAFGLGAGLVIMCLPLAGVSTWGWRLVFLLGPCCSTPGATCRRAAGTRSWPRNDDGARPTRRRRRAAGCASDGSPWSAPCSCSSTCSWRRPPSSRTTTCGPPGA